MPLPVYASICHTDICLNILLLKTIMRDKNVNNQNKFTPITRAHSTIARRIFIEIKVIAPTRSNY